MKRRESRQQLNQSLHATSTQITNKDMPTYIPGATPAYIPGVMPTYIPGATPLPSRPIKVHRFQEKMCPMSDQNLNCQKFPKVQRLWTCLPFRMWYQWGWSLPCSELNYKKPQDLMQRLHFFNHHRSFRCTNTVFICLWVYFHQKFLKYNHWQYYWKNKLPNLARVTEVFGQSEYFYLVSAKS